MPITCDTFTNCVILEMLPVVLSYIAVISISYFHMILSICKCSKQTRLRQWYLNNFITTIVEHSYGNILEKPKDEEEKEKNYIVFNFKVPISIKYWLYSSLVNVSGIAFIQFWDDFLLEESFSCSMDPNTVCFSPNLPQHKLNCSNMDDNMTSIVCYTFVFKLGSALGSSLGLISSIGLVIYITILLLLKVSNGSKATKKQKWITIALQSFAVLILAILTTGLWTLQILTSHLTTRAYLNESLKTGGIGVLMMLIVATIPWWKFEDTHTYELIP